MTRFRFGISVIGLAVVGFATVMFAHRAVLWSQERKPITPFTATEISYRAHANGTRWADTPEGRFITAVRSDGSKVSLKWVLTPDGRMTADRKIWDVSKERIIGVSEGTESVNTRVMGAATLHRLKSHTQACSENQSLPHTTLLGYDTIHTPVSLSPLPHGSNVVEEWQTPALDCFRLYSRYKQDDDSYNIHEVISVVRGEPDRKLFAVPAGYTERSIKETVEEFARRYPGHQIMKDEYATQLDRGYKKP